MVSTQRKGCSAAAWGKAYRSREGQPIHAGQEGHTLFLKVNALHEAEMALPIHFNDSSHVRHGAS